MKRYAFILFGMLVAAMAALIWVSAPVASAQDVEKPVVRAVLFHAEGYSHCKIVIDKVLPPLQLKHGDQLQIAMIEISGEENYTYFRQIEESAKLPAARRGVPALFIADQILVGDQEIPQKLPGLIQKGLAAGGIDYPALPGLAERLPQQTLPQQTLPQQTLPKQTLPQASSDAGACSPATPCPTPTAQLLALASNQVQSPGSSQASAVTVNEPAEQAPVSNGFGLATAVAVLLALSVVYALGAAVMAGTGRTPPVLPEWTANIIPVLCIIGLGVAGYLTFVETQNVSAVCGPIGDCNSVQSSPYAKLFGFLPVGVFGLAGYLAIIAAWAWGRWGKGILAVYAPALLLAMALFGALFSLYLTYIELGVILAVCIWCLTSAVLTALVLILAVGPAMDAFLGEDEAAYEGDE